MDERAAEFDELQNRLQSEAGDEQQKLMAELSSLKTEKKDLIGKLRAEADNTALMKRQNWWMTALQLKVKKIVADKLEQAQLAA